MGKNKGKGGKAHRRGKKQSNNEGRDLTFKSAGQEYGTVLKNLGGCRVSVYCFDGVTRLCHIRGKLRKKVWISVGDFVLVGLREFEDDRGDVLLKYYVHEARRLQAQGEIPATAKINTGDVFDDDAGEEEVTFGLASSVPVDGAGEERHETGADAWDAIIRQYEEDMEEEGADVGDIDDI